MLSQDGKDLQTQLARIKETIENLLERDTSLTKIIRTFIP